MMPGFSWWQSCRKCGHMGSWWLPALQAGHEKDLPSGCSHTLSARCLLTVPQVSWDACPGLHPMHKSKAWLKKFENLLKKLEKYFHSNTPPPFNSDATLTPPPPVEKWGNMTLNTTIPPHTYTKKLCFALLGLYIGHSPIKGYKPLTLMVLSYLLTGLQN